MAAPAFVYQDPLPVEKDTTKYRLLSKDYVSVSEFEGKEILKVAPEALTLLASVAVRDVSFLLRTAHLEKVAAILKDPKASDNDRYVALAMLRNADTAAKGILPFCQDTGTATIFSSGPASSCIWNTPTGRTAIKADSAASRHTISSEAKRAISGLPGTGILQPGR